MGNLGGIDEEMEIRDEEQENKAASFEERKPKRRPFHYWKVGEREYKLKLTTRMIEKVETKYRQNILNLVSVDGMPALSVMLTITQAAMSPWEHGVNYKKVQDLYDKWIEDGGNQVKYFGSVIMPTLAVSGFFTEQQAESMMESLQDMDDFL